MSRLQPRRAPPPLLPFGLLLLALGWGAVLTSGLAAMGGPALAAPAAAQTLALTHAATLGLLGNALFGGLLQFLPAAAGARALPVAVSLVLASGLNIGLLALLLHFLLAAPVLPAALLLAASLGGVCLGLVRMAATARPVALARGVGFSLLCLGAAGLLGLGLLIQRGGAQGIPWPDLLPAHALLGLWGWVLGTLLCVSSLAVPTLQGTRAWPPWALPCLLAMLAACLAAALWSAPTPYRGWLMLAPVLLPALLYLRELWRAPFRRGFPLRAQFAGAVGFCAAAALAFALHAPVRVPAVLALAGVCLLVMGMALEILPFLAWSAMQRRLQPRRHAPGVHALLGDPGKWACFALAAAGASLLAASLLLASAGEAALRRPGALLLAIAQLLAAALGARALWRAAGYVRAHGPPPPSPWAVVAGADGTSIRPVPSPARQRTPT